MIRRMFYRLAQSVVTLVGVSLLVFFITHAIPADPVAAVAGPHADKETRERIRKELGLSDPLWEQYGRYLWHVVQGDLGKSFVTGERVTDAILTRFPSTLAVSLGGVFIWLIVGVPLGVLTAKYRDKPIDRVALVLAMIAISLPTFWLGRLLQFQIAYKDGVLPVAGFTNGGPHLAFADAGCGGGRLLRAATGSAATCWVLNQDYIRAAALAVGTGGAVQARPAHAAIPVLTVLGMDIAGLLAGVVFTEHRLAGSWSGAAYKRSLTMDVPMIMEHGAVLGGAGRGG